MNFDAVRNVEDVRKVANARLPQPICDYLEGGADDEVTMRSNISAFDKISLQPKSLVNVEKIDLSTRILGVDIKLPIILSPTGSTRLFHLDGENAVARAAARAGTFYGLSTMANTMLEDVASASQQPKIFQLYVFKDREFTAELVKRCKNSGFHALCLTIDSAVGGNRERDLKSGMTIPPTLGLKSLMSFASHPRWSLPALFKLKFDFPNFASLHTDKSKKTSAAELFNSLFDSSVTWEDAIWLAKIWDGPLVVKGVMSAEDAKRAQAIGATAVMVSNHGGRQLDGTPAPIDLISTIRDKVGDELELIVDGGVRRGTHVLKALAAGANACSIGRPYLYGLAAAGEKGVDKVMQLFRDEIERDMILLGTPTIADITRERIITSAD